MKEKHVSKRSVCQCRTENRDLVLGRPVVDRRLVIDLKPKSSYHLRGGPQHTLLKEKKSTLILRFNVQANCAWLMLSLISPQILTKLVLNLKLNVILRVKISQWIGKFVNSLVEILSKMGKWVSFKREKSFPSSRVRVKWQSFARNCWTFEVGGNNSYIRIESISHMSNLKGSVWCWVNFRSIGICYIFLGRL